MAKKCDLCGRSATKGASRSHSKIKTLRRQGINLQSKTVGGDKFKLCTSCLRTMDKPKRVKTKRLPLNAESPKLKVAKKASVAKAKKPAAKAKSVKAKK